MRHTYTLEGSKARKIIVRGVKAIYEPVKRTLGPEGANALIPRTLNRNSRFTDDGKTVAENQRPKNLFVRSISTAFTETCLKTDNKAGDGTTTATIVAGRTYLTGYDLLSQNKGEGFNKGKNVGVISVKKGIYKTAEKVKELIKKQAKKIKTKEELENLAVISCKDDEIGKLVADVVWKTGTDGYVDVVEGYTDKIEVEVQAGMRFPAKVPNRNFFTDQKSFELRATDAEVLVTDYEIGIIKGSNNKGITLNQLVEQIQPILKKNKQTVLIAKNYTEECLAAIFDLNFQAVRLENGATKLAKTELTLLPVKAPSLRTEQFQDLEVYFGGKFIQSFNQDFVVKQEDLGFVDSLVVKGEEVREDATAVGGSGTKKTAKASFEKVVGDPGFKERDEKEKELKTTPVEDRVKMLKGQLKKTRQDILKEILERRIASLSKGVGTIRVGAPTDAEGLFKKLKVEDTKNACRSALRSGYVKGGGLCLKEIADTLPDTDLMKKALQEPYNIIQDSLEDKNIPDTVIDSADSVYYAVEYGSQVAAQLLTTDIVTVEHEDQGYGEDGLNISKAIMRMANAYEQHHGLEKQGSDEMMNDMLGGLSQDAFEDQQLKD